MCQREEVKRMRKGGKEKIGGVLERGYPTGHFALQNEGCIAEE